MLCVCISVVGSFLFLRSILLFAITHFIHSPLVRHYIQLLDMVMELLEHVYKYCYFNSFYDMGVRRVE